MKTQTTIPALEALEGRAMLSVSAHMTAGAPAVEATVLPTVVTARHPAKQKTVKAMASKKASATVKSAAARASHGSVVAFYGLGGQGWSNALVADMARAVAARESATAHVYLESQGDVALTDLFSSLDVNGDHVLTASETAGASVRVVGYSFGAIQAVNFARSLANAGGEVDGYLLAAPVPVESVVTIDPVNSTPAKHTDGVTGNVRTFTNFFERNSGPSSLHLTDDATGSKRDIVFKGVVNPIGDSLPSAARSTRQVRVDVTWATRVVTRAFDGTTTGSIKGNELDHATMPFYLFDDVVAALR